MAAKEPEQVSTRRAGESPGLVLPWRDLAIAFVIFVVAALTGALYTLTWGGPPLFWQEVFAPAVCIACDREPANPYFEDVPELADFLFLRADRFDCALLDREGIRWIPWEPEGWTFDALQASHPMREFPGFIRWQHFHYYLLWSVALCWKFLGVNWVALTPLFGLLYGLSAVFLYGLFRLVAARPLAQLLTYGLLFSPLQLEQLPHLRDYAKAPFFLGGMLAIGWFVKHPLGWRGSMLLACATGLFLGVGLGFRQDVAIVVMALLGSVLLFHPEPLRQSWRKRLATCGLFLAAFTVFGGPIALELRQQSNAPHDTLIGLLDYCDERLGVGNDRYDHGDPFQDEYTRSTVERYAATFHDSREPLRHYSTHYDAMASAYFREVILMFPADMVTRAFASVVRVLDELQPRAHAPHGWESGSAAFLLPAWLRLPGVLGNRYTAILAIALLAFYRPKWGLAALCLLYLFAGYPSLRFSTRHVFHLEFISLWIGALFLQAAVTLLLARYRAHRQPLLATPPALLRRLAGAFAVCLFAVLATLLPWQALARLQHPQVRDLLHGYTEAPTTPLVASVTPLEDQQVLHVIPELKDWRSVPAPDQDLPSWIRVLAFDVAAAPTALRLRVSYTASDAHYDFSRDLVVPGGAAATVYLPVYHTVENRFEGVAVEAGEAQRLGAWRLLHDIETMRILPTAILPEDWSEEPLIYNFLR